MSTFEQLRAAMAATFNIDPATISESTKQGDLAAWDSVGHIHLIVALEETFNIDVNVEDFERLTTIGALLAYVEARRRS